MSTVSLYQKYRPKHFDEVIGQSQIVNTINSQIRNKSIGHAYLFYGSRGLGKTTVARLMAKELGIDDQDLYEIDAASNRGIDDIREIREGVKLRPFSSPYKMYLIDEVHMLTKEAFNALLKTLEEPPNYIIFVLATTELHKVPDTIQSRSQVYTFVSPTHEKIVELVQSVAEKESVDLSEENASLIAFRAHGSYRDSLSELQKYISSDSYHESINDIGSLVESLTNYLTDPESTNLSHILETVQTIPDPKIVFELLLQEVSDRLYKKVTNDFQTKVGSVTLKTVLKYRNYYDQSSTLQIQRAGLMLLVMESNKL